MVESLIGGTGLFITPIAILNILRHPIQGGERYQADDVGLSLYCLNTVSPS